MNKKYRGMSVMKKLSLFASFALLLSGCGLMDGRLPMDAEPLHQRGVRMPHGDST
jgi:hypothetical protein